MTDIRTLAAAGNNADLYECVFAAHGLKYRRETYALVAIDPPPPYYASLTTTSATALDAQWDAIRHLRKAGWTFVFKDSFCRFDMDAFGMEILFEARWIWAPPKLFTPEADAGWRRIATADDLEDWEASWKRSGSPTDRKMFPASMLSRADIAFFGRRDGTGIRAGCIANLSDTCVGLSNLFSEGDREADFRAAVECVAALAPEKPIVGYDRGADLELMRSLGFEDIGPLRIWTAKS